MENGMEIIQEAYLDKCFKETDSLLEDRERFSQLLSDWADAMVESARLYDKTCEELDNIFKSKNLSALIS